MSKSETSIGKYLDLSAATEWDSIDDVNRAVDNAIDYGLAAVVTTSYYVEHAMKRAAGRVPVSATIAMPRGTVLLSEKVASVHQVAALGVDELDVMMNWRAIKDGAHDYAYREAKEVVKAAKRENPDVVLKLIMQIPDLTLAEKQVACDIVADSGAEYIKTRSSTVVRSKATTLLDLRITRNMLADHVKLKASMAVADARFARDVIAIGVARIGGSNAIDIVLDDAISQGKSVRDWDPSTSVRRS